MTYRKLRLFFSTNKREIAAYFLCEVICGLVLIWALHLWDADLSIPFEYQGDSLVMGSWCKALIDNVWWTQNSYLGMPIGQVHYDFPLVDTSNIILIKLLGLASGNFAISLNLFFLLTFPLTALTTLFLFRTLGISRVLSIAGSLVYTFIPYHFLRGEQHILLTSYFLIPLMVLVLLWVYQDMPILYNAEKKKIELRNYYTIVSLVICGLLALQYVYYSFFTCFFLLVIGVFHSLSTRDGKYLIRCSLLIGLIAAVFLINIAPALLYQFQNGSNPVAIIRSPRESEVYGLKIIQLLLPVGGHRVPFLAEIASNYANTAPLVNENAWSALGIFGALGFLLLIFWVFFRLGRATYGTTLEQIGPVLDCLATLNLSAVFLATIGGLGAFVAYIFSFQEIRGYNRISIFIALFAILAMILILDFIYRNRCPTGNMRLLFIAVLSVLLIGAILDQTTPAYIPDYGGTAERFLKDQRFIDTIEDEVPPGSMIFQLPYMMYPENGPIHAMPDYSPTIGYLHSRTLRWSYGSMKGRPGDNWQQEVVGQDLPEMLDSLAFAGFNGIYVDSYGYSRPMEILDNLSSILHIQPVISVNNRLYFFSLVDYNNRLKASMSADEWEAEVESVLQEHPYLASGRGCYSLEKTTIEDWRWCSSWGQLHLYNPTNESKMVRITTTFMSGYPEPSVLEISSPLFTDRLFITNQGTRYSKEFLLPPGHSPVTLSSEAKRVQAPGDARYLVFRMMNLGLKWL